MDSIKVIKKHGQPGGLPTVTVYVDADAPGESSDPVPKYLHTIRAGDASSTSNLIYIVSDSETPFTA